jgi:hypothetical protein
MQEENHSESSSEYEFMVDYNDDEPPASDPLPVMTKPKPIKRPKNQTSKENLTIARNKRADTAYKKKLDKFISDTMKREDKELVLSNVQKAVCGEPKILVPSPTKPPRQTTQPIKIIMEKKLKVKPIIEPVKKSTDKIVSPINENHVKEAQKIKYQLIKINN